MIRYTARDKGQDMIRYTAHEKGQEMIRYTAHDKGQEMVRKNDFMLIALCFFFIYFPLFTFFFFVVNRRS